jgi:L-seryl-tRNA(Ser) seleniumtransferase
MSIYEELGVRTIINASATLTRLGGSRMPPPVLDAMREAAGAFIDIVAFRRKVCEEIARLTRNEAAYVSCGAAAGLTLATAACITGLDPEKRERLPHLEGMKDEVIVHRHTRVGYDFAIRMVGVRLVEIGSREGTPVEELEAALSERTAAMFYFARGTEPRGEVPLEQAAEICRARGVPVIVDAAAQIPPHTNLWEFTRRGADLAIFSGGKGLRGPQAAGLVLGRRALIEAIEFNGPPQAFIGRGMKVGKEEAAGMLAAVRWYLSLDHEALMQQYESQVRFVIESVAGLPHVTARRSFPSEAGQPMPRAEIRFAPELGATGRDVIRLLEEGDPAIAVSGGGPDGIYVNPQTLEPGQEEIVARRIREVLTTEARRHGGEATL